MLLNRKWLTTEDLLCSIETFALYFAVYIYVKLNHFAVHLKPTQHCKSTIPPYKIKVKFKKLTANLLSLDVSLVAQTVKNLPAMQETQVQSLGQEDPLEKGMATHSSILGWRIPRTEEYGGLQSMGLQRVRHD